MLVLVAGAKDGPASLRVEEGGSLEFSTTAALVQMEVSVCSLALDPIGRRRAGRLWLSFVTPARLPAAGQLTPALLAEALRFLAVSGNSFFITASAVSLVHPYLASNSWAAVEEPMPRLGRPLAVGPPKTGLGRSPIPPSVLPELQPGW